MAVHASGTVRTSVKSTPPGQTLHQGLDLGLVIFFTVGHHEVGFQGEDVLDLDVFGATDARHRPKLGGRADAKFGLPHDIHVEVMQELRPTRHQRNHAHDAKVVRYLVA